jgi:hypothetical protein
VLKPNLGVRDTQPLQFPSHFFPIEPFLLDQRDGHDVQDDQAGAVVAGQGARQLKGVTGALGEISRMKDRLNRQHPSLLYISVHGCLKPVPREKGLSNPSTLDQ